MIAAFELLKEIERNIITLWFNNLLDSILIQLPSIWIHPDLQSPLASSSSVVVKLSINFSKPLPYYDVFIHQCNTGAIILPPAQHQSGFLYFQKQIPSSKYQGRRIDCLLMALQKLCKQHNSFEPSFPPGIIRKCKTKQKRRLKA